VDYCERNGIIFIPWFPLGAGRVAGEVLTRLAKAHQTNPMQVAGTAVMHSIRREYAPLASPGEIKQVFPSYLLVATFRLVCGLPLFDNHLE
jgi:diketogulonate reductase-like aldo/keto reductase